MVRWAPAGGAVMMDSTAIRIGIRKDSLSSCHMRTQEGSHLQTRKRVPTKLDHTTTLISDLHSAKVWKSKYISHPVYDI